MHDMMARLHGQVVNLCIWLFRYALIVLWADDNGQGGAFALFSLLKRQAELGKKSKVKIFPLPAMDMSLQREHGSAACRQFSLGSMLP